MDLMTTAIEGKAPGVTPFPERDLAERLRLLNARSWAEVRAGLAGVPVNDDEGDDGADDDGDDGSGVAVADDDADTGDDAAAAQGSQEDRLAQALEGFSQRFEAIEQRLPAQERQQQAAAEGPSLDEIADQIYRELDDEFFDENGQLTADGNTQMLAQLAREAARQELAPLQQAREEERREAGYAQLEQDFPELQDEKVQNAVLDAAEAFARELGNPGLVAEPAFIRNTYLALAGQQRAASETPASGTPVVRLGRGTSAAPAKPKPADDPAKRIVKLAQGSKFRLGSQ